LKAKALCGVAALFCVFGCGQEVPPELATLELETLLPEPSSLEGWQVAEGPSSLVPDNLWEYLNGGAPRYEDYGFQRLLHIRYQRGEDPLASVVVDVYDMGTELGAFGIYRSIRPSEAVVRTWGAEGYRSGTVAAAWKGSVFVHVASDDNRPELIEAMEMLVSRICEEAKGGVVPPPILNPLPPEGRVPYSERFVASDLLGHAAFGGGVVATYEIDGRFAELFFSELESRGAAETALATYRSEMERWAKVADEPNGFRFVSTGPVYGIVVTSGHFVAGASGGLPLENQKEVLEGLIARLDN